MQRYIAFLRAINVGGRVAKMDFLRKRFEVLGFFNVETFIASGNVIFESGARDAKALERQIESDLEQSLGYTVDTFLRTPLELENVLAKNPVANDDLSEGDSLYVAFLPAVPDAKAVEGVLASRTMETEFYVKEREIYCLFHKKLGASKFSGPRLEKTIGMPFTMRNITTVRKLAAKYPAAPQRPGRW